LPLREWEAEQHVVIAACAREYTESCVKNEAVLTVPGTSYAGSSAFRRALSEHMEYATWRG
jgi:hypothetical protein